MGEMNITVTFPPTPTSCCSVRHQFEIYHARNLDVNITEREFVKLPSYNDDVDLGVIFYPEGNISTVRYRVS